MIVTALKARFRTFNQLTGDVLTTETVFDQYDGGALTCPQAEAPFKNLTAEQAAAKRALVSLNEPIGTKTARNCSAGPTGDSITNVQPDSSYGTSGSGYVPDASGPTDPPPSSTAALPTMTHFVTQNSDIFSPGLEWSNGLARMKNLANPSTGQGEQIYYWRSGQPRRTSLPTAYTLKPGDEVQLYVAISNTSDVTAAYWSKKANILFTVGPAPL